MAKGAPFSIRLSRSTELYVEDEARRTKRSKSAIVQDLTEEAARMRRYPGIEFKTSGSGTGEAFFPASGFYIWMLIEALRDFPSAEELMEAHPRVTRRQIDLANAYLEEYPEEIETKIAANRRPLEERRRLYPFIQVGYVDVD